MIHPRLLLPLAALALAAAALAAQPASAAPHDGQHDFDFDPLTGSHQRIAFDGDSVTRPLWNTRANMEQFEISGPSGRLERMTLRLYNPRRASGTSTGRAAKPARSPCLPPSANSAAVSATSTTRKHSTAARSSCATSGPAIHPTPRTLNNPFPTMEARLGKSTGLPIKHG